MLRHRHHASLATLVSAAIGALAACQARDAPPGPSGPVDDLAAEPAFAPSPPVAPITAEPPLACGTLRDVAVSDVVRVDGTTLLYADAAAGLTIIDVADAAHPRQLATVPFVGAPLALFVREGIAWVVFVDWDARSGARGVATVVRAIDIRAPAEPRVIGEAVREGTARDAELVAGVLYLLRAEDGHATVEAFGVEGTSLLARGSVALEGMPAQLAASAVGLAAVTTSADHAAVAWLEVSLERPGSLTLLDTVRLPGGVATWERVDARVVDADEGQRVRVITCATRSCTPGDAATLRVVDFAGGAPGKRVSSLVLTEHDGLPTTRFADGVLYVAEGSGGARDASTLHVVRTDGAAPRFVSHLPLRGRITALVPRDGSLVALGTTGSPGTQIKIIVHDLDVRRPAAPRARSSVVFGSDWTWSVVADDERAMSIDPASHLLAVPFSAWRHADKRHVDGAQLIDLASFGGGAAAAFAADGYVERAVFLDGHLLTIGPAGVASVDYASTHEPGLRERTLELGR